MSIVLWMLVVAIAINLLMFIPAYLYQTDKLTDLPYAITFIVVALAGFIWSEQSLTHLVGLILVLAWALRLGTFLFIRIRKTTKDSRFDEMRGKFLIFLRFWLLQGLSVFVILIPSIFLWQRVDTKFYWISVLGIAVFAVGFLIESVADIQKNRFRRAGSSGWIDTGIWRMSRHPNYLGEIILWIGVYIFTAVNLSTNLKVIALLGPIYIATLLIFVSGIPLLEKSSDKKWGDKKEYKKYKTSVPVLVPTLHSINRIFK